VNALTKDKNAELAANVKVAKIRRKTRNDTLQ